MAKAARDKDRALAQTAQNETTPADGDFDMKDAESETEAEPIVYGSRTIIIHPGSQNLRIGLATDALPKTIPMVIARKSALSENEENDGEPRPKRIKLDDGQFGDESTWFGPEVWIILHHKMNKYLMLISLRTNITLKQPISRLFEEQIDEEYCRIHVNLYGTGIPEILPITSLDIMIM